MRLLMFNLDDKISKMSNDMNSRFGHDSVSVFWEIFKQIHENLDLLINKPKM